MSEITDQLQQSAQVLSAATEHEQSIQKVVDLIVQALQSGKKVILAGNGGSASQSTHIAAEFTGRYLKERKSLPAISLATDLSAVTAIGNDYGYDDIFRRQLEGLGNKGDIFIALSTSGNSKNLISALDQAKKQSITSVSLLGKDGGEMKGHSDINIIISSNDTPRIQEAHIAMLHIVCDQVEKALFP